MLKSLLSIVLLLQAFIIIPTASAAEAGTALKADSMRAQPFTDAKIVGSFTKYEKLQILNRQGAWLQVKTGKATGWVRLLSVRRGTTTTASQTSGALSVASGRAGTGQVVATTGVRGLSEQELKSAKFNEGEISKMESLTLKANEGQVFAASRGLKATKLDYLPANAEGAK
ncbi:MAG: SH3 domain-containing protein [Methylophilaceae bacterium]|nr:SH3 domain-containing protein [Methylophilaceae bacterium]